MVKHGNRPGASLDSARATATLTTRQTSRGSAHRATPPCRGGTRTPRSGREAPMTQAPTTRSFDPGLTGYRYPRAVQFYAFQAQAQTLRMAYMCAEPESSNQKSVLLLHGKTFSGAYWQPTIRELLREGFRVIEPDRLRKVSEAPLLPVHRTTRARQSHWPEGLEGARRPRPDGASETCARHSATTPYRAELPHEPSNTPSWWRAPASATCHRSKHSTNIPRRCSGL